MKRFLVVPLAAAFIAIGGGAAQAAKSDADDAPPEAISKFVMGTRLGYITCTGKYRSYLEKWDLYALMNEGQSAPKGSPPTDEDTSACVHETLLKGRNLYGTALKETPAAAAKSAMKDYMTVWEGALKDVRRAEREKPQDFRVRQRKVEARLDALQATLEAKAR
jgi:hypothetical protein